MPVVSSKTNVAICETERQRLGSDSPPRILRCLYEFKNGNPVELEGVRCLLNPDFVSTDQESCQFVKFRIDLPRIGIRVVSSFLKIIVSQVNQALQRLDARSKMKSAAKFNIITIHNRIQIRVSRKHAVCWLLRIPCRVLEFYYLRCIRVSTQTHVQSDLPRLTWYLRSISANSEVSSPPPNSLLSLKHGQPRQLYHPEQQLQLSPLYPRVRREAR